MSIKQVLAFSGRVCVDRSTGGVAFLPPALLALWHQNRPFVSHTWAGRRPARRRISDTLPPISLHAPAPLSYMGLAVKRAGATVVPGVKPEVCK